MKRILVLLLVLPFCAQAQLIKCVTPEGKVEYRDYPCDKNTKEQEIKQRVTEVTADGSPKPAKETPREAKKSEEEKKDKR